jgi:hypothetical protein
MANPETKWKVGTVVLLENLTDHSEKHAEIALYKSKFVYSPENKICVV